MKFYLLFISAFAFNEDLNPSKEVNNVNFKLKILSKRLSLKYLANIKMGYDSEISIPES